MVDDIDPGAESDLRRRAAWLLGMLALVAVLFVLVMTTLINTGKGGGGGSHDTPGALDRAARSAVLTPPASAQRPKTHRAKHAVKRSSTRARTSTPPTGTTSCPTQQTCVLQGDVGNGVAAINAYRAQHGLSAVPGTVSAQAQTCAFNNGSGCSGGWAETELAKPDGAAAVQKILPFAKLDDSQLRSIEVGWAYDPSAKLYYFAIVRND